jgi:signal transduction histidine kinase/CheY-like chemotaxis protein
LSPHGFCLLWRPELLWTHVISDAFIFLAYMTIPAALAVIIHKRKDIPFSWVIWSFALFITACGFTHFMGIWTLWHPDYGVEALVKAITAIASVATALALWWLIPFAVALPSPARLRAVNQELERRIQERDQAIAALQRETEERQRAEAALAQAQRMDALGQLTGGIAHDFNNLLQAIQGSLDLINRRPDDPAKVRRLAEGAVNAAERGARLTSQLLAFSRTRQLKLESFLVSDLAAGMRELLALTIGADIDLRFDLTGDEAAVLTDRNQAELALLNLVINARDAMPEGGRITIKTDRVIADSGEPDLAAGDYMKVSVIDTGIGMTPEVMAKAFEPFFTTKPVGQGTGLGLSQVYGFARHTGGAARVSSAPGAGAVVSLLIPVGSAPGRAAPVPRAERPALGAAAGRVLVVDDDESVRGIAVEALRAMGVDVLEASGGGAALALCEREAPDLALLDFAMPGMNGADLATALRQRWPELKIVFVTGYADVTQLDGVLGPKARILRKPYKFADLQAALTDALPPL